MSEAKPFSISKGEVWEAYKRVKANQGAAGVDEQSWGTSQRAVSGDPGRPPARQRYSCCDRYGLKVLLQVFRQEVGGMPVVSRATLASCAFTARNPGLRQDLKLGAEEVSPFRDGI